MNWPRVLDFIFPYIEKLTPEQQAAEDQRLQSDIVAIEAADYSINDERALDEAQKVSAIEMDRVRTAEGKASTYLAVLAALVPLIITLQAANWEKKAGPAPDAVRLFVLAVATIYIAAAGYHAFKTLQVQGFQRVGEAEIAAAWRTRNPLRKLTRGTLLATRRSRNAVNDKITRILVTHAHLLRAFAMFVLLLLLDPLFYAMGFRNAEQAPLPTSVTVPVPSGPAQPRPSSTPSPALPAAQVKRPELPPPATPKTAVPPEATPAKAVPQAPREPGCTQGAKECPRPK